MHLQNTGAIERCKVRAGHHQQSHPRSHLQRRDHRVAGDEGVPPALPGAQRLVIGVGSAARGAGEEVNEAPHLPRGRVRVAEAAYLLEKAVKDGERGAVCGEGVGGERGGACRGV